MAPLRKFIARLRGTQPVEQLDTLPVVNDPEARMVFLGVEGEGENMVAKWGR